MNEVISAKGTCLCGSVALITTTLNKAMGTCHCTMCRKWSAGPYMSVDCGQDVKIEGKENLVIYDSSEWADRGFCKICGSSIFYRLKQSRNYYVSSEIFNIEELKFRQQVYIDCKPDYYSFAEETHNMTESEALLDFSKKK